MPKGDDIQCVPQRQVLNRHYQGRQAMRPTGETRTFNGTCARYAQVVLRGNLDQI